MNTHLKQIKTSADSAQKCFADDRPSDALYHINGIQDRVQRMLQSSAATAEIHLPPFTLRRCPNGMLWLQRHDGEGMEVNEASFTRILSAFFTKHF